MTRCPHCGGVLQPNTTVDSLRAACAELGIAVAWDDSVSEREAARLLNRSPWTMRNRRLSDRPIEPIRSGGRWRYALSALANYLDAQNSDETY